MFAVLAVGGIAEQIFSKQLDKVISKIRRHD